MTISMENEFVDLMRSLERDYEIDSVDELFRVLDEHQQILKFYPEVDTLTRRAMAEGLDLVFHLFTDGADAFYGNPSFALSFYLSWRAEGRTNTRLYYQLYKDRENDEMEEEDCLISFGNYPD